jgi:phosphoenolpyruvate carboxylase
LKILKNPKIKKKNVREYRRGNQTWTIQRNWQQDEEKQNKKHNIICVEHHYTQTNTNNVNKT